MACPGDRQVVHGAVDREFPDRAAGENQRTHHEGIGGQGQPHVAAGEQRRIGERRQGGVGERGQKETFYQLVGRLAPGPVAHVDPGRRERGRTATVLFERGQDALLVHAPTLTFSGDVRPKV